MSNGNGILRQLGFSSVAEQIYLILLKKGACSVTEIAQLTGKHRPIIYKALPDLTSANLIAKLSKGKRILYQAESPANLAVVSKRQIESVNTALPKLLEIFEHGNIKPKVSFFEGKEGIETVYEHLISGTKKGGSIYRYESPRDYKRNKRYYPALYWRRAGASGDIDKYVITNKKTHRERHANLNRLSKAAAAPFEDNITEIVGDSEVVFIDFDTETAIVIENQRFADFQRSIYKMLFEKL